MRNAMYTTPSAPTDHAVTSARLAGDAQQNMARGQHGLAAVNFAGAAKHAAQAGDATKAHVLISAAQGAHIQQSAKASDQTTGGRAADARMKAIGDAKQALHEAVAGGAKVDNKVTSAAGADRKRDDHGRFA